MPQTFTATANSSSTIGYAQYGSTSWHKGSSDSNGACQGAHQETTADKSRVGIMIFTNAGSTLWKKSIQSITFSITCAGAGSNADGKVLTFRKSTQQSMPSGVTGSAVVGETLGTLTGLFYKNTTTHTLNASSNATLFNALRAYLAEGNSALVLYNGETSTSSGYSANFARITAITMTVTYVSATVYYRNGSAWVQCLVYYRLNGAWVQVIPYYNSGGTWVRV